MRILFALLILVPLIEILILIRVGKVLGGFPTIALVIGTALLGVMLLKKQGRATLDKARLKMAQGSLPAGEMADGLFLAVGGALLLAPGFLTDLIGFACLIPLCRRLLLALLMRALGRKAHIQMMMVRPPGSQAPGPGSGQPPRGKTIEGEYHKEE